MSYGCHARVCAALLALVVPAGAQAQPAADPGSPAEARAALVFDGRAGDTTVDPPRIDAAPEVDGHLDEAVWTRAARLTGFSRYAPVDGAPADEPTDVLVWYSPTAVYFGIRATAAGGVRATLADRDKIDSDDHILIFLGTFNDQRQATVFGVNPLGVQMDGAMAEGTRAPASGSGGGFGGLQTGRETPDLSPDFVFESKGRVTDEGYEVEVRIPFKSLRYQAADRQDWGVNITRVIPQRGVEDSWTPARKDEASFLAQSGTLRGLHDLSRGLVLDLNPVATAKIDGASTGGGWGYEASRPEVGLNVRWGLTANLTLNGAVNPDFSQVEADAGQFLFDPRQALFFPEKRPFFLDGIEQFSTPNNLIYTRRVVAPIVAAKITGKVSGGTNVAMLTAVDDEATSASGHDTPLFNVVRVQRDIGGQSRAALVYTDRIDGDRSNRVVAGDARFVWKDVYSLQLQAGMSRTAVDGAVTTAPIWQGIVARAGRRFGFRYTVRGIGDDFRAAAGFLSRTGVAGVNLTHQVSFYGPPDSVLEKWSSDVVVDGTWQYERFVNGLSAQDRKLHFNNNFTFRGGWRAGGSVLIETFGYDERLYQDYRIGRETATGVELLPFTGTPRLPNLDYVISANTPQRGGVTLDAFLIWGRDENFYEWSSADIAFVNVGAEWRPTEKLRVDARYQLQSYKRRTDGSTVAIRRIPRLKFEYQIARPIFVRFVGEYDGQWQDALRDDSRTGLPLYVRNPGTGTFERAGAQYARRFRADWLFSYQPTPGTVFFAGYGSTLDNPFASPIETRLRRSSDGFFLKLSYLFRL
ncbi:MAG: DUF5916 domain-containing protein [Vicinamibacterales bacterium]